MKKTALLVLITSFISIVSAQDKTYSFGSNMYSETLPKVAIAPFEDKMYLSDINKEIAKRTGLSLNEIENTFREGIIQTLINLGSDSYNFIDPMDMEEEDYYRHLGEIYSCISYSYEKVVPIKAIEMTRAEKLVEKLEAKEAPDQLARGTYLEGGEIKEWYDKKERFMNAQITNEERFKEMIEKYDLDFVLTINELDIQVMRDHSRDVGQTWNRRVKIHFTIFDDNGKQTFGSAVYQIYDGQQKDIYSIIRKNFRTPCAQIITKIDETTGESSIAESSTSTPTITRVEKKSSKIKKITKSIKPEKSDEVKNDDDF